MRISEIFNKMDWGTAPENDKNAKAWLKENGNKFGHFINGNFIDAKNHFKTKNPANNQFLANIAVGSKADVNLAVKSAATAQNKWAQIGGHARARYLYAIARLLQKHSRLFAVLETIDNGKPIRESRDIDIPLAIRHFYYHAGAAQLMDDNLPNHEPVGICGQIIPWNFPLLMLSWKIAPAIAMGNTVILKPAEYTSLTALLFAQICIEASIPKGVINIVTGDGTTGSLITKHKSINKIAFTGSTEVGRKIRFETAGTGKSLTLELGGKSPYIVFDDADVDSAIEGLVDSIWFNQGQVCCAGSRLLVHETIANQFYKKLKLRMKRLRIGDPLDKSIDMGAIVDPKQLSLISRLVNKNAHEGNLYQPDIEMPNRGSYYPPTLITEMEPSASLMQEEIFGPVLVSTTFRTPKEAIALANNSRYGLAASIWTENINLALDIAPKIECGVVWINSVNQFDAAAGFGGRRESGFGREGGAEGLLAYVKPKSKTAELKKQKRYKRSTTKSNTLGSLDKTLKLYIGGKQVRPDSGYSKAVFGPKGFITHIGDGNRKDIRNAVEAAHKAGNWSKTSGHLKAQILYYLAENLDKRGSEFIENIILSTGVKKEVAQKEVETSISRLFYYAAWADKFDGAVHDVPIRGVTLAMNEPLGVVGVICPEENPLLGLVSLAAPLIAMGNTCVLIPSASSPNIAANFYQVLDTSDVPAGVLNIITGEEEAFVKTLSEHHDIAAIWYFGAGNNSGEIERFSTASLKRTWVNNNKTRDWHYNGQGKEFLNNATDVKNIWIPYGE
jgi:aldehyde dehydrogenase (NAD+)